LSGKVNVVNQAERWASVKEVAQNLGVNRDTLYKWIKRTDIPAHKVGRLWKFKLSEVDLWARSTPESTAPDE